MGVSSTDTDRRGGSRRLHQIGTSTSKQLLEKKENASSAAESAGAHGFFKSIQKTEHHFCAVPHNRNTGGGMQAISIHVPFAGWRIPSRVLWRWYPNSEGSA